MRNRTLFLLSLSLGNILFITFMIVLNTFIEERSNGTNGKSDILFIPIWLLYFFTFCLIYPVYLRKLLKRLETPNSNLITALYTIITVLILCIHVIPTYIINAYVSEKVPERTSNIILLLHIELWAIPHIILYLSIAVSHIYFMCKDRDQFRDIPAHNNTEILLNFIGDIAGFFSYIIYAVSFVILYTILSSNDSSNESHILISITSFQYYIIILYCSIVVDFVYMLFVCFFKYKYVCETCTMDYKISGSFTNILVRVFLYLFFYNLVEYINDNSLTPLYVMKYGITTSGMIFIKIFTLIIKYVWKKHINEIRDYS